MISKSFWEKCTSSYEGPQNDDSKVNTLGIPKPLYRATLAVPCFERCTKKLQSPNEKGACNLDSKNGSSLQAKGYPLSWQP